MKFKKDGKVFEDIITAHLAFCRGRDCSDCAIHGKKEALSCVNFQNRYPAEAARLMGYEVVEEDDYSSKYNAVRESCNQWPEWKKDIYNSDLSAHAKPLEKEANMDKQKPLKDWTLGEVKEYCREQNGCKSCKFFKKNCRCWLVAPREWDLSEKPREKDDPNAMQHDSNAENALANTKPRICEVLGVEVGERFFLKDENTNYHSCEIFVDEDGYVATEQKIGRLSPEMLAIHAINHPEWIGRKPRFTEEEVAAAKAIMRILLYATGDTTVCIGENGYSTVGVDGRWNIKIKDGIFPSILPGTSVKISDIVGGEA